MGNQHINRFIADLTVDGWIVSCKSTKAVLYDGDSGDMSEQEARDLAWAWNWGAGDDDEAVGMIIDRYGHYPDYLKHLEQ